MCGAVQCVRRGGAGRGGVETPDSSNARVTLKRKKKEAAAEGTHLERHRHVLHLPQRLEQSVRSALGLRCGGCRGAASRAPSHCVRDDRHATLAIQARTSSVCARASPSSLLLMVWSARVDEIHARGNSASRYSCRPAAKLFRSSPDSVRHRRGKEVGEEGPTGEQTRRR